MVTVVSCYYLIKSKFSPEKYINWISNYLRFNFRSVIFCNEETKSILLSKFPDIINNVNIILKVLEIDEFEMSKYNWEYDIKVDPEIKKGVNHSISLYKIWNEKIYFLQKVANENPFKSEYFLWMDIGSFRVSDISNKYEFPQPYNFKRDKITMFLINFFKKHEVVKPFNIDNRFLTIDRYGGLFGGNRFAINNFADKHTDILKQFKGKRVFSGKDQSIYNFIGIQYPDLIDTVIARDVHPTYDRWFASHFYFSKYTLPTIDILIPIYNGIEYIDEAIRSVREQTYRKWNIIIGVNGYELNSSVYQRALEYKDENIIVLDLGRYKGTNPKTFALNDMMRHTYNNWIALLDVDDVWFSRKLEEQVKYIYDYDIIGTKCQYIGESDKVPKLPVGNLESVDFSKRNPVINSSVLLKRELCYWEDVFLDDYTLWLKLKKEKYKFYNLKDILVYHRIHSDSAFNSKTKK